MSIVQKACDRCTQGVMDADNPHLHGLCRCPCHPEVIVGYMNSMGYVHCLR